MKKSRKLMIAVLFSVIFLFFVIQIRIIKESKDVKRLSEEEILQLREEYPISGLESPPMVDMMQVTLEEYIESINKYNEPGAFTFVYGEVVGEAFTYDEYISTGIEALDDKNKSNGIDLNHEFYGYKISVIKDTEGRYQEGDQIVISANIMFIEYNPTFSDGMRVVVPVLENDPSDNEVWYDVVGMYYITENDYAISAYDEETLLEREPMSGMHIDKLLKQLHKMIK